MTFWELFWHELKVVLSSKAILTTVIGGVLLYSFLYPLPYANKTPREQAIVVVNLDGSQVSRKLERMVDATPQVRIASHAGSLQEAKQQIIDGKVSGLLVIPDDFNRDLIMGRSPVLSYAGDASYFLIYGTIIEGLGKAGGTLAAQVKVSRMVMSGQPIETAAENYTAIKLSSSPVFNPSMSYINYVVPAIFIFVLHQTLLMGLGMQGGAQTEMDRHGEHGYWQKASVVKLYAARILVFFLLYISLTLYYLGFCYQVYGVARLADISELCLLVVPFLLSAAALGLFIGAIIPRREIAVIIVLASSFPIVFSAGFIWPSSAIPFAVNWVMQWIPVTVAVQAFLSLNQMGADFSAILPQWYQLWGLALLYFFLAVLCKIRSSD